jgi:DNA-binding helix-hairpin-helix protein with protein kinase domain
MTAQVLTACGVPLRLGRELGKGGEGAVFEVRGLAGRVAKLYHQAPDPRKQAKLRFMAAHAERALLTYSAWPQATLHRSRGGPPVGFLMRQVSAGDSIHAVYSPAQRRQHRPDVAWDFLLFVARNTAAAFDALHAQGHVLGDVNQGNVVVGDDSQVVLIDCDSFQVNAGGTLYPCEVGVAHFTPPELQGLSCFAGLARNANHDNFGLALLVFHLLFGGRHPYSGVPLRDGVGDALESDIRAFRYAYARDARRRGMAPPPRALPIGLVPPPVERMFQLAFTEAGTCRRPTAREWMAALDDLRTGLRRCPRTRIHLFPGHLHACPWCELEREGVMHFVDADPARARARARVVMCDTWSRIEAVAPPPPLAPPHIDPEQLCPRPLPSGIPGPEAAVLYRFTAVALAVALWACAPEGWFFACIAGALAWAIGGSLATDPLRRELRRRRAAVRDAQQALDRVLARALQDAGPEGFARRRARLAAARERYRRSLREEADQLAALAGQGRQRGALASRIRARHAARRAALEAVLCAGPGDLQRFAHAARQRAASLRLEVEAAARRVAQAQRDLSII